MSILLKEEVILKNPIFEAYRLYYISNVSKLGEVIRYVNNVVNKDFEEEQKNKRLNQEDYIKFYNEEQKNKEVLIRRFLLKPTIKTSNVKNTSFNKDIDLNQISNDNFINQEDIIKMYIEGNIKALQRLRNKVMKIRSKKTSKTSKSKIKYLTYPIDNTYLFELLNKINFDINNDYIIGLKNLLEDNNMIYNHIAIKIIIAKYLVDLKDLNKLKVFEVENQRLNEDFKFLVFKNNKIKDYTKLYFKDNMIIFNTLKHDNISSVILTNEDNINNIYGKKEDNIIIKTSNDIDIKKYQYTVVDNEYKVYSFIVDLINVLKNFKEDCKSITIDINDIKEVNLHEYLNILNKNYNIYYRYEKLTLKYEFILKYFEDLDNFKSNELDNITTYEDYNLYEVNLNDYFIKL